ncbi:MAG: hypothetical protein LKE51_10825 [Selenomonas sp.]|jgi:heptose-I-phosphate ethanolaminephosphotransferase|nr:hypothetical protein [Selenomonas sp.]
MGAQYFMPILLPILAALVAGPVRLAGSALLMGLPLPNLLTGLGWCTAFPLLYAWTYSVRSGTSPRSASTSSSGTGSIYSC